MENEQHVVGYYNAPERAAFWGKQGAFWGGLFGLLFGSAMFMVPGFGTLFVLGPLAGWILGAIEGAVVVGGLSALGAALYSIGIPKNSVLQYEADVKMRMKCHANVEPFPNRTGEITAFRCGRHTGDER